MRGVRSSRSTATSAAAALLVMSGLTACANGAVADEPPTTAEATDAAAQIVSIPMPDFEPWPEGDPFTEEDAEAARLANADSDWQGVLATYPDAVRPEVAFEGYVTQSTSVEVMRACYEAAGLPIDEGRSGPDPDDPVLSISTSTDTPEEAIAAYACRVAHPHK